MQVEVKNSLSVVTHLFPFIFIKNTDPLTHQQGPHFITSIKTVFEALATHWTDSPGPILLQIFVIFLTIGWYITISSWTRSKIYKCIFKFTLYRFITVFTLYFFLIICLSTLSVKIMNKGSHPLDIEIQLSWSQAQKGQFFSKNQHHFKLTCTGQASKQELPYYVPHKTKVLNTVLNY